MNDSNNNPEPKSLSKKIGGAWNLNEILRTNICNLKPYSSARDEFSGSASIFLDANENPNNTGYNRYPDPHQIKVKEKIAAIKGVAVNQIFLGNGSDEPIDIVFRAFCEPGVDNVVSISPTYGMYRVAADVNNIEVIEVALDSDFNLNVNTVLAATNKKTKAVFLCSPNNPSGNLLKRDDVLQIIRNFEGVVVVDEAYIDFAIEATLLPDLSKYPNLIVLQTFSKAWGLAGIRLGMAFASPEIIAVMSKIKYPYNINILTQKKALAKLDSEEKKNLWVAEIIAERSKLADELAKLPFVEKVFRSDSNFLLVRMNDARGIFDYLMEQGIIVRDRSKIALCNDSLRITVGRKDENKRLLKTLKKLI